MPVSGKEFLDIHANIECGFTLKCVRDIIRTYSTIEICALGLGIDVLLVLLGLAQGVPKGGRRV